MNQENNPLNDHLELERNAELLPRYGEAHGHVLAGVTEPNVAQVDDSSYFESTMGMRSSLLFEAQRRSADYHLGQYLEMKRSIWKEYVFECIHM